MTILCMGDSLTYGFGVPRKEIWTQLVQEQKGCQLINAACNGNTTGGMLAYFPQEVQRHHPDVVFLMGGGNNILLSGSDAAARSDISGLAHLCYKEGIHPVIGIPFALHPPIRRDWGMLADVTQAQDTCEAYAEWLRLFCRTFQITFIDFHAELPRKAAEQGVKIGAWYLDGIHLNAQGHQAMAEIFLEKQL